MIQLIMLPINLIAVLVGFLTSSLLTMIGGFMAILVIAAGVYGIAWWLERM